MRWTVLVEMLFSLPLLSQGLSLCASLGEIFNTMEAGWLLQWETQGAVGSFLRIVGEAILHFRA